MYIHVRISNDFVYVQIIFKAHSGCSAQVTKLCDFGDFNRLILPPYAVFVPNLALWRRMSNEATTTS